MKKQDHILLIIFLLLLITQIKTYSQINSPDNSLPEDTSIIHRTLSNGFTYYIIRNKNASKKILAKFIVKAGFGQQKASQFEAAHTLEHILIGRSCNSSGITDTTNSNDIKKEATTALNFTEYTYEISSITNLSTVLDCLKAWINQQDQINIENFNVERKIVIAEHELNGFPITPETRILKFISNNSEIYQPNFLRKINHVTVKDLENFHSEWYQPRHSGLILSCNIDPIYLDRIVEATFKEIKNNPPSHAQKKSPPSPKRKEKYLIETLNQKNNTNIRLYLLFETPKITQVTYNDLKQNLTIELFNQMLKNRINDLYIESETNIFNALSFHITLNPEDTPAFEIFSSPKDTHNIKGSLKIMLSELERIRNFGFSEAEISNAKQQIRDKYKSESNSNTIINDAIQNFLYNYTILSNLKKDTITSKFLSEIDTGDINKLTNSTIVYENMKIALLVPSCEKKGISSKKEVQGLLKECQLNPYGRYEFRQPSPFIVNFDAIYAINDTATYTKKTIEHITENDIRFSNGARTILVETKNNSTDIIHFKATKPIGLLAFNDTLLCMAKIAANMFIENGIGELKKNELKKYLSEEHVSLLIYFEKQKLVIEGSFQQRNAEPFFQILHRIFTPLKIKDSLKFEQSLSHLARRTSETKDTQPTLKEIIGFDANINHEVSIADFKKLNYKNYTKLRKLCFTGVNDLTFTIAGAYNINDITSLCKKYIGNIQNKERTTHLRSDVNLKSFNGPITITRKENAIQRTDVQLMYLFNSSSGIEAKTKLRILTFALEKKLTNRIREQLGETYYVTAILRDFTTLDSKTDSYQISISFSCSAQNAISNIEQAKIEIKNLFNDPATENLVKTAKSQEIKYAQYNSWRNQDWCEYLINQSETAEMSIISELQKKIESITTEEIIELSKKHLTESNLILEITMPHSKSRGM